MKTLIILKVLFLLPGIIYLDYLILALIGCTSCLMGAESGFYCGPYCIIGKIVLGLSGIFILYIISPDIKQLFKNHKNATTTQE